MVVRLLIALFVLSLFSVVPASAADTWGCCIPPYGECFDGAAFSSEGQFQAACEGAGDNQNPATVQGAGQFATCTSFGQCTIGCCCAGPDILDSPTINSDEELLRTTGAACGFKDGYAFSSLPAGSSCVAVCGGTGGGTGGGGGDTPPSNVTYTVTGTVLNASSGDPLPGAEAFIPVPNGEISSTTDANGAFTLTHVPIMNTRVFVVHPQCQPAQSPPFLVDRDVDDIEVSAICHLEGCPHESPTFVEQPASVRGTSSVRFVVNVENACQDFTQFEPLRCDDQFANCIAIAPTTSSTITDVGLAPETTYCYRILARFADGSTTDSGSASEGCITTGDALCMQETEPEWCGAAGDPPQPAQMRCDEQNLLDPTICEPGFVCSERSGAPACVSAPACQQCNGLLGLFARLLGGALIPDGLFSVRCDNACMLDSQLSGRPLMVDAYSACLTVNACSSYHSQQSCDQNTCGIDGCSWRVINEELGQGVCTSDEHPACSTCSDLFGYCSKEMCAAISDDCYFDAELNGLASTQGCLAKEDAACRYYDTQADCVGAGANANYNVQYAGDSRSSGDNARTRSSADALGIGACSWNPAGFCYKNADMRGEEDDCIDNGRIFSDPSCVIDSTPPVTTVFLSDPAIYSRLALRNLPYSVIDDTTPVSEIKTYICFEGNGMTCAYPTDTFSTLALPEEGTYTLKYYSIDANENSEVVKTAQITVKETAEPGVEEITIEENQ